MRSARSHGKQYLKCASRYKSYDACIGTFISAAYLEQMVLEQLKRLTEKYLDEKQLEQKIELCSMLEEEKKKIRHETEIYRGKTEEYARGIRQLYLDKVKGIITETEFVEMSKEFADEKIRLEQRLKQGTEQLAELERRIGTGERGSRHELIKKYINPDHLTREAVDLMIEYISVGRRTAKNRPVPVEIYWKF